MKFLLNVWVFVFLFATSFSLDIDQTTLVSNIILLNLIFITL